MKTTIDLLPREFSEKRSTQNQLLGSLLLGLFLVSAILLVGVALLLRARTLEGNVQPLRERVAEMRPLEGRLQPLSDALGRALLRQDTARKLLEEPRWNALISDLTLAVSGDIWIQSLELEQRLAAPEGQPPEAPMLVVSGTAATEQDLLRFMNALAASEHLSLLAPRESRQSAESTPGTANRLEFVLEGTLAREGSRS